jgi:hypothetical protein
MNSTKLTRAPAVKIARSVPGTALQTTRPYNAHLHGRDNFKSEMLTEELEGDSSLGTKYFLVTFQALTASSIKVTFALL